MAKVMTGGRANASDRLVRTALEGSLDGREVTIAWDGKNQSGRSVPTGDLLGARGERGAQGDRRGMLPTICGRSLTRFVLVFLLVSGINIYLPSLGQAASAEAATPPYRGIQPNRITETHVFRFFLHPDLVAGMDLGDVRRRLVRYVDDINQVFAKNTNRQFSFDPMSGLTITATAPQTDGCCAHGDLPETGYEVWAHAVLTDMPAYGTYGGYMSMDSSGAAVAAGLHWARVWDPDSLAEGSVELGDYWREIDHMIHEIEHVFGAGMGEYYNLATIHDATQTPPLLDIDLSAYPSDLYWGARQDFMPDPLLRNAWNNELVGNPSTHAELLATVRLSDLSAAIANTTMRRFSTQLANLPDMTRLSVVARSSTTGAPIDSPYVKVWTIRGFPPYESSVLTEGAGDANGEFVFDWGDTNPFSNNDFLRLIKVYKPGYAARAKYISTFDAQAVKLVAGLDHITIDMELTPDPAFVRGDTDDNGEVNISDPIMNLAYQFAGGPPPTCEDAADDDDSGEVNISDPIYSLNYQFAGGAPPQAPFPGCGPDPTADQIGCDEFPPCDGKARPAPQVTMVVDGSKRLLLETVPGTSPDSMSLKVTAVTDVPLAGLEGMAGFDPSRLQFVRLVKSGSSRRMDFLSARSLVDPPRVRLGGVPDFGLTEALAPGTYEIGRLVFARRGPTASLDGAVWLTEGRFVGKDLQAYKIEGAPSVGPTNPGGAEKEPAAGSVIVFPNPYHPNGPISLRLGPTSGEGDVAIYDVQGRRTKTLYAGSWTTTGLNLAWDGRSDGGVEVAAGLYYLSVRTGLHQEARSMLLLR